MDVACWSVKLIRVKWEGEWQVWVDLRDPLTTHARRERKINCYGKERHPADDDEWSNIIINLMWQRRGQGTLCGFNQDEIIIRTREIRGVKSAGQPSRDGLAQTCFAPQETTRSDRRRS